MIKIDMMMPIMCSACRFENGNLSCIVSGLDTYSIRGFDRHPDCPLYPLDEDAEITGDQVIEYCRKRHLVVLDAAFYKIQANKGGD